METPIEVDGMVQSGSVCESADFSIAPDRVPSAARKKALFVLRPYWFDRVYGADDRAILSPGIDFPDRAFTANEVRENPQLLQDVEMLFSGWDGGKLDKSFLEAAPRLKIVFFAGGSVRNLVTDEFWKRDILLTSAAPANAVPVAEFTFAQIILALKHAWGFNREFHRTQEHPQYADGHRDVPGAYQTTIGIVSIGTIGRRVCEMLRMLDVRVLAYDPFATEYMAEKLGVELVSLNEMFRRCEVVSIHAPLKKETIGLINGNLIAKFQPGATLINTSRGGLINEEEMIEILRKRPDLSALLDVTRNEPLERDSPLFSMPNVFLTPHIAGSLNKECRRMGRFMIEEAGRFLDGQPLRWTITQAMAETMA